MKTTKGVLTLLLMGITITLILFPVAILIHEGTHYIMYTLEGIDVTSFHVLDSDALTNGYSGYIKTEKLSRYGSLFQEAIAYFVECLFLASTLLFCLIKPLKSFTIRQLELIGVKKKTQSNP